VLTACQSLTAPVACGMCCSPRRRRSKTFALLLQALLVAGEGLFVGPDSDGIFNFNHPTDTWVRPTLTMGLLCTKRSGDGDS
jgi:hypothetical protein